MCEASGQSPGGVLLAVFRRRSRCAGQAVGGAEGLKPTERTLTCLRCGPSRISRLGGIAPRADPQGRPTKSVDWRPARTLGSLSVFRRVGWPPLAIADRRWQGDARLGLVPTAGATTYSGRVAGGTSRVRATLPGL